MHEIKILCGVLAILILIPLAVKATRNLRKALSNNNNIYLKSTKNKKSHGKTNSDGRISGHWYR